MGAWALATATAVAARFVPVPAPAPAVVLGVGCAQWITGAAGAGSMPGSERLIGIGLGVMLLAEFLKDEERSGTHECMGWEFGGDHWFEVTVVRIEPTEQVEDLAGLGDRMTDLTQLIGKAL